METSFKLPSPLPSWPTGGGFATGTINLGGLEVCQISSFTRVWATREGGQANLGATFYKPSQIPTGFFIFGSYCQENSKPLFGWVLAGKADDNTGGALQKPVDYTLVWSSASSKIKQDGHGYIWHPTPPQGYVALGHLVTSSPEKPSVDQIRCVRSDLTDVCENDVWLWGPGEKNTGPNVYSLRPTNRGDQAEGVSVGTFVAQMDKGATSISSFACLKNKDLNLSPMPNLSQIDALMQAYSPWIYFHPDEIYLPSSVTWYFSNGALLYKQGNPTPTPVDPTGTNLPQGGTNDGTYWLDLPVDPKRKEKVTRGELETARSYLHVKPMLGATFTDLGIWVFYPFNGPARAKAGFLTIPLGKTGGHVGDWEHLTLRISNFSGELWRVYFSQHSGGKWVDASGLEFKTGNKAVAYSSLHGHALYPKEGLVLQGNNKVGVGIRNDTKKGGVGMDTGIGFELVSAEYLGSVEEPPWLKYARKWGPKISYSLNELVKLLPGGANLVKALPAEILGEDGPTGPKMKRNWNGDEV